MAITRWLFDYGGQYQYTFPRNPDRLGGDTYWNYEMRSSEIDILGSSLPTIQIDGFRGATRTIRFTGITGSMMRTLEDFYFRKETINNCRDHLYDTTPAFSCIIIGFSPMIHATIGNFPGSGEDTWDLEITLVRTS